MDNKEHKEIDHTLLKTLDVYFSRGVDSKKFIDVNRIPLICQDISNIHGEIREIKGNIKWFTRLILGTVILGLIGMIIKIHI